MIHQEEYIKQLLRKQFDGNLSLSEKAQLQAAPLLYSDEEWDVLVGAVMADHTFVCSHAQLEYNLPVARAIIRRSGMKGPALLGMLILLAWGALAYYFWSANTHASQAVCENNSMHPWISPASTFLQIDSGSYAVEVTDEGVVCISAPDGEQVKPFVLQTSPKQIAQLELPDGSKIWLNAGSSVTMSQDSRGENREVYLNGEGYFEINDNRITPFVVRMDSATWASTSSAVNLNTRFDRLLVTVISGVGMLRIHDNRSGQMLLQERDIAFYEDSVTILKDQNLDQARNWMKKNRTYKATSLETVVTDLAGWNGIQLHNLSNLPAHPITFQYCFEDDEDKLFTLLEQQRVRYHYETKVLDILPE